MNPLAAADAELNELLAELARELEPTLSEWDSDARIAYRDAQAHWARSARRREEILAQLPRVQRV